MPTVFVNNITMNYVEAGQGSSLLLLHGVGGSHEMWLPIVPQLARSYRVIAADHRGHGASDKPRGQYTVRLFADDWLALMDALRVDRAHLLGLSMGGAIAMRLAVEAPQRVRSLILVDTWAHPHPEFLAMMRQRIEKLAAGDLAAYAEVAIPQVFSPRYVQANPQAMAEYRQRVARANTDSLRSAIGACMSHDMHGALARIQAPTLVITGSEDRLVPPYHAEYLHRAIPKVSLRVIEGSGHIPHLEAPERFLRVVLEFLSSVDRPGSS
jgi:3-oxoadipate enol-lactonase